MKRVKKNRHRVRNHRLLRNYGISLKDYKKMLKKQFRVCKLCGQKNNVKDWRTGRTKALFLDHCHKTGKIRGILCHKCNFVLGTVKDSVKLLKRTISYLQN